MKIKLGTVFSGIGAIEQACFKVFGKENVELLFACDNGERTLVNTKEEIDKLTCDLTYEEKQEYIKELYNKTKKKNFVKESYFANYDIDENRWYEDIRFIDGNIFKNKLDILCGGSPCQSFSIIGKKAGLNDARGTLFYDFARLVSEAQPKVFIYENVVGMLTHDKGNTWKVIKEIFNSLNYKINFKVLDSVDYGVPQHRKRIYVVGFRDNDINFTFPEAIKLEYFAKDFLEKDVDFKYYLGEKGFKFCTNPKYKNRVRLNRDIIQTQKANQQFNWCGDLIFEPFNENKNYSNKIYIDKYNNTLGVVRKHTPRECLRLMGFSDDFKIVVPDKEIYRQSGNSIVVNVLEHILYQIKIALSNKVLKVATVFSGIGAIEFALRRLNIKHNIVFACDNGERDIEYDKEYHINQIKKLKSIKDKKNYVDNLYNIRKENYVKKSYLENYNLIDNNYFQDICLLDGTDFEGKVDLFVGGSPCQSFSSVGFQGGLEDTRGTLFYEFARLVNEIKPKVFIYENVRNLINHDNGNTWEVIKKTFDSLGYYYYFDVLNASDYNIPQNRRRLFVIGFKKEVEFTFPKKVDLQYKLKDFTINNCSFGNFLYDQNGDLVVNKVNGEVDEIYTLSEKIYDYVMSGGTKSFYTKPKINLDIARTLLKTMGNRHRAGVDNYLSFDGTDNLGSVRMLTEREAHRLMGFTDDYKIVVSRAQAYKQAGNSIVVDVLMSILKEILKTTAFEGDNDGKH